VGNSGGQLPECLGGRRFGGDALMCDAHSLWLLRGLVASRHTRGVVDVMEAVPALLRQAAEQAILPVFGRREARPEEKSPGEWVTTADRAAEALLAPQLATLLPGSLVVGEEAASLDPSVLDHLATDGEVWLLDPLDGTSNFAAGEPPFAVMVALLRRGETVASWMLDPLTGRMAVAERGAGAWLDGERVRAGADAAVAGAMPGALRGGVTRRFLPADLGSHVEAVEPEFAELMGGSRCAGHDYPAVVTGDLDFILFWRTLPWDHIPGALFVSEAGGVAARLDGSAYRAADHARPGLLVARDPGAWTRVRDLLVPEQHRAMAW
jgi:fructose-1,6-bisphosphatase/inositol monophosphatase family enzyme